MSELTITAWNVQEKLGWEDQRPAVLEQIKRATADTLGVVVLSDAFRELDTRTNTPTPIGDSLAYMYELGSSLGYQTFCAPYNDTEPRVGQPSSLVQNLIVMTNMPTNGQIVRLATRNALALRVKHEGEHIDVTGAHFDDRSRRTRFVQAHAYVDGIFEHPAVLAGDLNAMHNESRRAKLFRGRLGSTVLHLPGVRHYGARLVEMAKDDTLDVLEMSGMQDADAKSRPTMCGPVGVPVAQLDHIMYTQQLRCGAFTLGKRGPSDHRWIRASMSFAA